MKTIVIGDKKIGLRATPLALLNYQQAFKKDLMADLVSLQEMGEITENNFSSFDSIKLLQITYAMNKADNFGKQFPDFENWLNDLGSVDFADDTWLWGVIEEAEAGFFRSAGEKQQEKN